MFYFWTSYKNYKNKITLIVDIYNKFKHLTFYLKTCIIITINLINILYIMINKERKIIMWISWWADSMFLYNFLKTDFLKKNITIAHFNHKFRKESDNEQIFLKNYFKQEWVKFISEDYIWSDFREWTLRKARYYFFKKHGWGEFYLALWHNLTDRIETSFLNILRWTWLKGFLNMKKLDTKNKIYRPLLDLEKDEIQDLCESKNIPYFIDYSNFDSEISKRNMIRNDFLSIFKTNWMEFSKNFNKIYKQIEDILPDFKIEDYLKQIESWIYELSLPKNNTEYFIRELLDFFNIFDFRSNVIPEIIDYIENSKWWGFKQYKDLFIFKKKNIIYLWKNISLNNIKNIWQNWNKI